MKRIRQVSQIVRVCILAVLAYTVFEFLWPFVLQVSAVGWHSIGAGQYGFAILVGALAAKTLVFMWYWVLAKLFLRYGEGKFFASETIHCIKLAGVLCIFGWVLSAAKQLLFEFLIRPSYLRDNMGFQYDYRIGFFNFDIGIGIDFGLLLAGAVLMLIAWIMDEARKIQEEQELTV